MKRTISVLTVLGICAAAGPANLAQPPATAHARQVVEGAVVSDAIGKGMQWLKDHPADVRRHELLEVAEEIMFYYSLSAMASAPDELERYRNQIATRHAAMSAFNSNVLESGFHLQGIWGPLTYPPLAHIIARSGMAAEGYRAIIDDMVANHPHMYPPRDAMQLWIAMYMGRLGYTTPIPVGVLLESSTLREDPQTGSLLDRLALEPGQSLDQGATVQFVYDLTHEVFALTDFGALPAPAATVARRGYHARLFEAGIRWAMQAAALDILAELLVSAHLLGLHDLASAPGAVDLILRSQEEDGSFGVTNPDRPDGRRHGVLTCLLALKTVGTLPNGR